MLTRVARLGSHAESLGADFSASDGLILDPCPSHGPPACTVTVTVWPAGSHATVSPTEWPLAVTVAVAASGPGVKPEARATRIAVLRVISKWATAD